MLWLLLTIGSIALAYALRWAVAAVWTALISNRWNALDGHDQRR